MAVVVGGNYANASGRINIPGRKRENHYIKSLATVLFPSNKLGAVLVTSYPWEKKKKSPKYLPTMCPVQGPISSVRSETLFKSRPINYHRHPALFFKAMRPTEQLTESRGKGRDNFIVSLPLWSESPRRHLPRHLVNPSGFCDSGTFLVHRIVIDWKVIHSAGPSSCPPFLFFCSCCCR